MLCDEERIRIEENQGRAGGNRGYLDCDAVFVARHPEPAVGALAIFGTRRIFICSGRVVPVGTTTDYFMADAIRAGVDQRPRPEHQNRRFPETNYRLLQPQAST